MYELSYSLATDEISENPSKFITVITGIELTKDDNRKSMLDHTRIFNNKNEVMSFLLGLLIEYPFNSESLKHRARLKFDKIGLLNY